MDEPSKAAMRAARSVSGPYGIDVAEECYRRDAIAIDAEFSDVIEALRTLVGMNNCNYDRDTEDYREAMLKAAEVLGKVK